MFPFSLLLEDNHSHDFYAPDEKTYHFWQDGINALLSKLCFLPLLVEK